MTRKITPGTTNDAQLIDLAIQHLKRARVLLNGAGSGKAAAAVSVALKSVEGAQRHVSTRIHRTEGV